MKILEPGKVGKNWSIQHRCTAWGNIGGYWDVLAQEYCVVNPRPNQ